VSSESRSVRSAPDADETVDEDKVHDEHEPQSNVMNSANGSDDVSADDVAGESVDSDCTRDSKADPDTKLLCHSTAEKDSHSSDLQATADMDQCGNAKSDSGHSSPCSTNADDIDTEKAPGISLWNSSYHYGTTFLANVNVYVMFAICHRRSVCLSSVCRL